MADNYQQTATVVFCDLADDEESWLVEQLDGAERLREDSDVPDTSDVGGLVLTEYIKDRGCMPFEWIIDEDAKTSGKLFWVFADGTWFDPEGFAEFVQAFLKKFRPASCAAASYSYTCSRPRRDEFGGGAVFVTASKIKYKDTLDWTIEKRVRHKQCLLADATHAAIEAWSSDIEIDDDEVLALMRPLLGRDVDPDALEPAIHAELEDNTVYHAVRIAVTKLYEASKPDVELSWCDISKRAL